jgi:hypothetical protein
MFFSTLISWIGLTAVTAAWNATDGWQGASAIKFDDTCSSDQRDVIRLAWMDAMNMTSLIAALPYYEQYDVSYHELFGPSDLNYSTIIPGVFSNMTAETWKIAASCDLYDSSPTCNDPYM